MNAKRYPPLGQTYDFCLLRVTLQGINKQIADNRPTNWIYMFFGNFDGDIVKLYTCLLRYMYEQIVTISLFSISRI